MIAGERPRQRRVPRTALDPVALLVEGLTTGGSGGLSWLMEKLSGMRRHG